MYENLIAFLLGKKNELTEDELNEFMELLVKALNVEEEYETLEKQAVVESIVDSVAIKDQNERRIISSAIENILEFEETSGDEESGKDIFMEKNEENVPLKMRKVKRGEFRKTKKEADKEANKEEISEVKPIDIKPEEPKGIEEQANNEKAREFKASQIFGKKSTEKEDSNIPGFNFELGELEEDHRSGPEFSFRLDE